MSFSCPTRIQLHGCQFERSVCSADAMAVLQQGVAHSTQALTVPRGAMGVSQRLTKRQACWQHTVVSVGKAGKCGYGVCVLIRRGYHAYMERWIGKQAGAQQQRPEL